jgi:hypothetical protein
MKAIKKDNNIIEIEVSDEELNHIEEQIKKFNEDFKIKSKEEIQINILGYEVPDFAIGIIKSFV